MNIFSVKEKPEYANIAIAYFQKNWATEDSKMIYEDSIFNSLNSPSPLPEWYLMYDGENIAGCAGLITNDFISRMDLYPWLCALYIEENYRGNAYGSLLMEHAKKDAKDKGFDNLYLSTDHIGYYEKYGFEYIGLGYHPWGESSRIYKTKL